MELFDCKRFLTHSRACLIAPAGYGKTHSIVDCLESLTGRFLILTHTHAGVAVLRERIKERGIPTNRYELTTISSLCQKLAVAYTSSGNVVPIDSSEHYTWLERRCKELAETNKISHLIEVSYGGVLVDEYQDCSKSQHDFIIGIARSVSLWIFGDPLQGIFDFNGPIVDWDNDLVGFYFECLDKPKRWEKYNVSLGLDIVTIRKQLEVGASSIDWGRTSSITRITSNDRDKQDEIRKWRYKTALKGTQLIIVTEKWNRKEVAKVFGGTCRVVEAIDDSDFYTMAAKIDRITTATAAQTLYDSAIAVFFKSKVDEWLTARGVKVKKDKSLRLMSAKLAQKVSEYCARPSSLGLLHGLEELASIEGIKVFLHEKFTSLKSAITLASERGISVKDAMMEVRNKVRIVGRKIANFAVGTTLLTKGLEFDHVLIVNANRPYDLSTQSGRKNFYVAISRARESLTIIDE